MRPKTLAGQIAVAAINITLLGVIVYCAIDILRNIILSFANH